MSTSQALSNLHASSMLEVSGVRRELQRAWDNVSGLRRVAESDGLQGLTYDPPSPRSFRTDNADQAEILRYGHGPAEPATGGQATHWTNELHFQSAPSGPSLLGLPQEVLDMITSFAVGGQVIHVTDAESVKIEHRRQCQHPPSTCRFRQSYGPEFFIRVCSAVPSEDEAWKEFRSGYEDIPEADEEEYYVADGHLRHQKCRDWEDGNLDCTQQLDLPTHAKRFGIFRVCRQLSFSAFRSFWTTNTFSFGHASSFGKFLSCLNDTEKMAIRRIDLNIHEFSPQRLAFDPCQIMKLQQLDTLHLCMHSSLLGDVYAMEDINPQISQIDIRKQPGKDILRLEVLDIKHLTVIVYDHESEYTVGDDRFEERFTLDEKRDLAKLVEATLMAPSADRRILAQGDREIFEMEELLRGLRYAQDVRWQTQRGSFQIWSDDPSEDNDHDPAT